MSRRDRFFSFSVMEACRLTAYGEEDGDDENAAQSPARVIRGIAHARENRCVSKASDMVAEMRETAP